MNSTKMEVLFNNMDQAILLLQNELTVSYVESLAETLQNLSFDGQAQQMEGQPSDETIKKLNAIYKKLKLKDESSETFRKLVQLAFIKAIKEDKIQTNHQMTPDTIAYLIAYFIAEIKKDATEALHIHDLASGTGNLLTVVMDYLQKRGNTVSAEAVDNDDLLVALASNSANLQNWNDQIQFVHSDSLQELLIKPADIAVADLPVGYYPMDDRAKKFETSFEEGHSFAHFLMIEQHLKYVKDSGWGFFIIPKNLFESDENSLLIKWLKGKGYLQAILNLPETLFQSASMQKAILILQKEGENAKQAKQVLLGDIPNIKDARKMKEFIELFHNWSEKML